MWEYLKRSKELLYLFSNIGIKIFIVIIIMYQLSPTIRAVAKPFTTLHVHCIYIVTVINGNKSDMMQQKFDIFLMYDIQNKYYIYSTILIL